MDNKKMKNKAIEQLGVNYHNNINRILRWEHVIADLQDETTTSIRRKEMLEKEQRDIIEVLSTLGVNAQELVKKLKESNIIKD